MNANIGDRIVLEGTHLGDARREGVIVEVAHGDGTPPYTVEWADGRRTVVYPGPDARIGDTAASRAGR
ncbi:DUF1918 domain-containing protein [Dactylosporangium sp. NPDC049140]|jgi:hypothetical protein|uniref:DUF1918 domain-containing protein n=1 Tax=Dactylosporangium sp. NPDC049140 TaxID=3155647 RepID=UPI0033E73ECA